MMGPVTKARARAVFKRLERGPAPWPDLVAAGGISRNKLGVLMLEVRKMARGSRQIIPRPVSADGYLYRLTDAHYPTTKDPGIANSALVVLGDNLTRGETAVQHMAASVEGMGGHRTRLAKLLRTLQSQLESANTMVAFAKDELALDLENHGAP